MLIAAGAALCFFPLISLRLVAPSIVAAVVIIGLRSRPRHAVALAVLATIAAIFGTSVLLQVVPLWWLLGAVIVLLWRRSAATVALAIAAILLAWTSWRWPDAALVALAYGFPVVLVLSGAWLLRPWRWRAPKVWIAAVVIIAAAAALASTPPLPSRDDFYEFRGEIPSPGTLLRVSAYSGAAPQGATALRLLYATTRADDSAAVASAVASLPEESNATVLAWQHGTIGVARSCAPSLSENALTPEAIPAIEEVTERGWSVVATDYPGQGTAGRFPYLIGQGEGRATLDAVRAIRQLDEVPDAGKNMLWGHSQGGHATLFADQISADYAPELEISGVAALSAAADPRLLAEGILGGETNSLGTVIGSYVLVPYAAEYPDVRLRDYVHPVALSATRAAARRCADDKTMLVSLLATAALETRGSLVDVDLDTSAIGQRLRDNTASAKGTAPLFLGQGVEDEVVPIAGQAQTAQRFRESGRVVIEKEYPGRSHMGVIAPDSPLLADLLKWADSL